MTGTLAIADLLVACDAMRSRNLALFEVLGGWVAGTDEPDAQRLFAIACHRHAWHAELWAARTPTIPIDIAGDVTDLSAPATPDVAWYHDQIVGVLDAVAAIGAEVDGVLDPGTARVIALVTADLTELRQAASR